MRTVGKHEPLKQLDVSECDTLPGCDVRFLDSQINGAAFMLQRSLGKIPVSAERGKDAQIADAVESLESVRTYGGYLGDGTGFGKTMTALLFASYFAKYADHSNGHRPMIIITPNGAVFGQWIDVMWRRSKDLTVIISNDDKPPNTRYLKHWVSSTAMREAPKSMNNWPEHLQYVFDPNDPRASKTVFVTPYDTHKDRTIETTWKKAKVEKSEKVDDQLRSKQRKQKRHHDEEL